MRESMPAVLWCMLTSTRPALARLNGVLPKDIVVHAVSVAPAGFNARFSAVQRRYLYRICDQPELLDPLRRDDTLIHRRSLDADAMHAAAQQMLGLRDFAAFAKRRDGATTIRTLLEFSWVRASDGVLEARVVADAFCRSMVRALVGAVIPVGEGRRPVEWPGGGHLPARCGAGLTPQGVARQTDRRRRLIRRPGPSRRT